MSSKLCGFDCAGKDYVDHMDRSNYSHGMDAAKLAARVAHRVGTKFHTDTTARGLLRQRLMNGNGL